VRIFHSSLLSNVLQVVALGISDEHSETDLQRELEEASVGCEILKESRQSNLTTLRRIIVDAGLKSSTGSVAVWVGVRRSIEQVEDIGAELQGLAFVDAKILEE